MNQTPAHNEKTPGVQARGFQDEVQTNHAVNSTPPSFTKRQQRLVTLIWDRWVAVWDVRQSIGVANPADLVAQLRRKFGDTAIETRWSKMTDRDGRLVEFGEYRLSDAGRERLLAAGWSASDVS